MHAQKLQFLQYTLFEKLNALQANAAGKWGKMQGQQMVEHLSLIMRASSGKIKTELAIPQEFLSKARAFLWSDKEFRENTKAPAGLIPDEPLPLKNETMKAAVEELKTEVDYFTAYFKNNARITEMHPAFGELNFEEWVQIHHKHVVHHLKQFGLL